VVFRTSLDSGDSSDDNDHFLASRTLILRSLLLDPASGRKRDAGQFHSHLRHLAQVEQAGGGVPQTIARVTLTSVRARAKSRSGI
jgi:hypothetical protein